MANSVDPDAKAHYELSHLDLHCLLRDWFWSAGLKGLIAQIPLINCSFFMSCITQQGCLRGIETHGT